MFRDWQSYQQGKLDGRNEGRHEVNSDNGAGFAAAIKAALCLPFVAVCCALFPLTAAATAGAWAGSLSAGRALAGQLTGFNALLAAAGLPLVVAGAVLAGGLWCEARLAAFAPYWWARHVVRLTLLGAVAFVAHFRLQAGRWPVAVADVRQSLGDGVSAVIVVAVVGLAHWVLRSVRRDEVRHYPRLAYGAILGLVLAAAYASKQP